MYGRRKQWKIVLFLLAVLFLFPGFKGARVYAASKTRLVKSSFHIVIGESKKISVKNIPKNARVTYKSKNSSVAAVSGTGRITGKKAGTTRIKVTVKIPGGRKTLTCKVIVSSWTKADFSQEYRKGPFYRALRNVTLTGNYRRDIIAVAESQIGYQEGNYEDQLDGTYPGSNNYTEYGRYEGSNGRAWCSEFASWCARQAGVPVRILADSRGASIRDFKAPYHTWKETVFAGGDYLPQAGDLVLFAWNGTSVHAEYLSHTAIVHSVQILNNSVYLTILEGNGGDCVRKNICKAALNTGRNEKGKIVYFIAPDY